MTTYPTPAPISTTHRLRAFGAAAAAIAAIGGGWAYTHTSQTSHGAPAPAPALKITLRDRLLAAGAISGFRVISPPNAANDAAVWAAKAEDSATPARETRRLRQLGFVAGIDEHLRGRYPVSADAISIAEQYRSPAGASAELAYQYTQQRQFARTHGLKFTAFRVSWIPGARGWQVTGPGIAGRNIMFAAGPFYYVVGAGAATSTARGLPTQKRLDAAAGSLYLIATGCALPRRHS